MVRKLGFVLIMAVLILSTSIGPAFAQTPVHPTNQPNLVYLPVVANGPAFQVVVNPTQMGWTSDQVFGNAPVSFNNYLYDFVPEDIFNSSMALKVLRSADGINWEYAGMPYPQDSRYNSLPGGFVYQDHLYIALNRNNCLTGTPTIPGLVLRTANGKDWEKVFQAPGVDGATTQTGQLGMFNGMLYVTTVVGHSDIENAQIWRSPSGDKGTWELATPVFGTLTGYTSMPTTFKDNAYISSVDAVGVHIWRSADGEKWKTVGQDLLNDPAYTNWWVTNPVVFNDALYVGTNPMVFAFSPGSEYTGGQLYRSTDGVTWQMVVKQGFGGTLSPSGIDGLIVYNNQLYALSNDLALDGYSWGTTYVWRSPTGNPGDWVKVSPDGMGPNTVVGFSWEAIFKGDLYIGNGFGMGDQCDLMKLVKP